MTYVFYFYAVALSLAVLLTIPYTRWYTLLKTMQNVNPTQAFVSSIYLVGSKVMYNIIYTFEGDFQSVQVHKGIGRPLVNSTIPVMLVPKRWFNKKDLIPCTMEYIVQRTFMYVDMIMIIMAVSTTITLILMVNNSVNIINLM